MATWRKGTKAIGLSAKIISFMIYVLIVTSCNRTSRTVNGTAPPAVNFARTDEHFAPLPTIDSHLQSSVSISLHLSCQSDIQETFLLTSSNEINTFSWTRIYRMVLTWKNDADRKNLRGTQVLIKSLGFLFFRVQNLTAVPFHDYAKYL